ncbi:hypothetical protein SAMN05660493_02991 [Epilithonimonas bovis DSM 19482]|uniref:CarboxypepD_reg-like domain-containing protein n=1 Tax=Epilithonimonas bovis DSM 19482 TaxID=1121284 RepID=A0A1U7Q0Y9_9FLAO|nr:hypothetical protein [Epilithonimonas bovis]SIT98253.1 hypothetical protein SAMN05660493_02991 [Epilithonimonas bovis DSM 19482]
MKTCLPLLFVLISGLILSQNISGKVMSEDEVLIPKTLIVNMRTNEKTYSDSQGSFTISAKMGDEIRFAKERYKLAKILITNSDQQTVRLEKIPQEIEEVRFINKNIVQSQEEGLRTSIGLPKGPEKPREKPVDLKDDFLRIPPIVSIQNIYNAISGKSRRLKRLYKYEDLQEGLSWIRNNIDYQYFADAGIPAEKMNDFLMFALRDERVLMYMKAKNIGGITVEMDRQIDPYLEVLAVSRK